MKIINSSANPKGEIVSSTSLAQLSLLSTKPESTKQEMLHFLLRGQSSAQVLAEHLEISPQAIRRHLKDLTEEGLIQIAASAKSGLGRPQHFYVLTKLGRDRLPASYDRFAIDLLTSMLNTLGKEQAAQVLGRQWQTKAMQYHEQLGQEALELRLEKLAMLRRKEGYVTEWYSVPGENPKLATSSFIFTEYNCAIAQIAESFPSVCTHELEMFATALPDCQVERTHWMIDGEHRCGYLIRPFCHNASPETKT
jgi:DeoR family transcriptional regulator, suf operon transcriptional repressor